MRAGAPLSPGLYKRFVDRLEELLSDDYLRFVTGYGWPTGAILRQNEDATGFNRTLSLSRGSFTTRNVLYPNYLEVHRHGKIEGSPRYSWYFDDGGRDDILYHELGWIDGCYAAIQKKPAGRRSAKTPATRSITPAHLKLSSS
jgi:hypothetical protein